MVLRINEYFENFERKTVDCKILLTTKKNQSKFVHVCDSRQTL